MSDKAIRSAKLTAAGILDKARARTAVTRAGGQIAPSKYLPDVPRQVHADGGRVGKAYGGGFGYVPQAALPQLRLAVAQPLPQAQPQAPKAASWINALTDLAKKPEEAAPAQGFGATMPTGATTAPPSSGTGATIPEGGFYAPFKSNLDRLIADAPGAVNVTSGYRTPQRQQELWEQHAAKYPDPEVRDNYVARPGSSSHNYGLAADLSFASPEVQQWVHDNAAQYGLQFRMDHEGWHVEPTNLWELRKQMGPPAGYADGGKVTDNENFQSWFGNSVTHTNGEPHVLYTGTSKDKDFTGFNVGRHGAWFTRDPAVASSYAEENDSQGYKRDGWNMVPTNTASRVIPAYVKAENPYTGDLPPEVMSGNYKASQSAWFDTLRAKGHDAWVPASHGGNLVVALKEPQQIKSIYNSGKFDPNQKHMGKAEGGEVEKATTGSVPTGTQAFGLPGSGGVRGGEGFLPAPPQASGEADLTGLPKSVKAPKLGMTLTASHDPRIRQVSRDYAQQSGIQYNPPTTYQKVDPARAKRIADAYEAMPHEPNHPLVKASYEALLNETKGQYDAMKRAGVNLEFYPDVNNDPYKSNPRLAVEDIRHNNHMYVYPTNAGYGTGEALPGAEDNPMLRDSGERWNGQPVTFNDLFRAVHDYFGHAKEGVGFRADGEENAWRQHAAMFSPLARIALGTETRGQNSWLNYGPHGDKNRTAATEDTVFADQKLGVLPHWVHHEGAEDFIPPHERKQMQDIYKAHGKEERFPAWSRSEFTPEKFSSALKSSPFASTLTQYDASEIKDMVNKGKFSGYKLAGKDAYFGIKHDANYAEDYGFEHPALTGNEKALVGVVNNDKTARGLGDSLMKEAIKQGVTALDAFAVPSDKHPRGFLTDFYAKHGFKELGRVPFDPKYVTPEQFADMKRAWKESGWDEKRHPMPDVAIMKRASGGAVMAKHTLTQSFSNGGAARLMKARKVKPVDAAMALTRRFTKDGAGATMALKPKGK